MHSENHRYKVDDMTTKTEIVVQNKIDQTSFQVVQLSLLKLYLSRFMLIYVYQQHFCQLIGSHMCWKVSALPV